MLFNHFHINVDIEFNRFYIIHPTKSYRFPDSPLDVGKKMKNVVFREKKSLRSYRGHTKVVQKQKNIYNLIKFN